MSAAIVSAVSRELGTGAALTSAPCGEGREGGEGGKREEEEEEREEEEEEREKEQEGRL